MEKKTDELYLDQYSTLLLNSQEKKKKGCGKETHS